VAEFLAMGRPVILPRCNIGNELTEGENALLLENGTSLEIAARLRQLIADPALAERLGRGARAFAEQNLSWEANAVLLSDFYRGLLGGPPAGHDPGVLVADG
jgi:glycosyltransferase involved in cell wall biosynthesis